MHVVPEEDTGVTDGRELPREEGSVRRRWGARNPFEVLCKNSKFS